MKSVPGAVDLRIQQPANQPKLFINLDRSKAQTIGFNSHDIAGDVLVALSGSFQTAPNFWLSPKNGVSYNVIAQAQQHDMSSLSGFSY